MEIISRSEASSAGLSRYFTGKACRKGHVAERKVNGGHCAACDSARVFPKKKYVWTEKRAAYNAERYHRDVEKSRAHSRVLRDAWRRKNGQLTMSEYRARVHEEFLVREAERAIERQRTAAERLACREARKAETKDRAKTRYAATVEHRRERSKAWRAANPGRQKELVKAWKKRNVEKVRLARNQRKTRKRVTLTRELARLQKNRCAYCRVKLDSGFHVDHVQPLKRGGLDHRSNLQLTCEPCNLTKSAKDPIDFAQSIGRLL